VPDSQDPNEFEDAVVQLEDLLRHVNSVTRRQGRRILREFDLTPPQHNALVQLHRQGNLTIGELSENLYLAFSTATDLINRMERNGLVARERDTIDRRVVRVNIMPKGEELLKEVVQARRRYYEELLREVPHTERQELVTALRRIDELMSERDP